jgi:adenosylcobinamide-phosphate synthase
MVEFHGFILLIILGAILLDLWMGDPKWLPHPVIGMGNIISYLEQRWNQGDRRKIKGGALTFVVVGSTYLISYIVILLTYQFHVMFGMLVEIYLLSTTIAIKGLKDAALNVSIPLRQGNLKEARWQLSMIVGRDTDKLDEVEVVRGTVETVAENTVDGIVAPLFWAVVGGAPLALAYRAINTLDSMVGYKNERYLQFGWASARFDDLANLIPARLTALCIWLSAIFHSQSRLKEAISITYRDAPKHPSPNSGWPEAMVAGLIGIQLGGFNKYKGIISERARMGQPTRQLTEADIQRTIYYMHGGWIMFIFMITGAYFAWQHVIEGATR